LLFGGKMLRAIALLNSILGKKLSRSLDSFEF
jgi:hypothetical protein